MGRSESAGFVRVLPRGSVGTDGLCGHSPAHTICCRGGVGSDSGSHGDFGGVLVGACLYFSGLAGSAMVTW